MKTLGRSFALQHQHAAVDLNGFAAEITRGIGSEKRHDARHLFRRPDAANRNPSDVSFHRFGSGKLFVVRRVNHAGRDGVDSHAERRKLFGKALRHGDESALRG